MPHCGHHTAVGLFVCAPQCRNNQSTRTGRPCGDRRFVAMLENLLGRRLWPQESGRKPEGDKKEEKGQLDILMESGM